MTVLARGSSRGARSEDVRRGNLSTLLRYVHVHGPTARSRLTAVLGLNRSTIGDLTGDLVAAGLVCEEAGRPDRDGTGPASSGGRPSYVVRPETHRVQVLAADVGVTHLTVARVGLGGTVLGRRDRAYRRGTRRQRDVTATIAKVGSELLAEMEPDAVLVAVGVAVPGMVRRRDGQVRQAPNLGWQDAPLGAQLADLLGLPVAVGNDADLGILAEHVRGAAQGVEDAVYLSGHSGIGAGIIAGGVSLGGRAGYAGEVGHIAVNPGGLPCHCGSYGCWETECGEERLFELAGRPAGGGLAGVRHVVAAAADGDPAAQAALEHVAGWLGRGTANVVNVLNPQVVILGGALEAVFNSVGSTVRDAFETAALAAPLEQVRLVTPHLGPDSTVVGAAELAFDALLSDPLLELSRRTAS
jgi:predicted NBD/HSP70 family sugar kinase